MAKTYFPFERTVELVTASKPHPDNTYYKVSRGTELWDGENVEVFKVQMVYDGEIAGRRSPSYPVGTDDHQRVQLAIEKIIRSR
ncbi:hypothetical protein [Buttiauxella gaviniae]|uniref:hypothetical protein n=1 Tax=Buttiauxella gaviniae TaxID=82990 RepID=UPI0007E41027|nr:hypothetical protein [Buttiauxella gaviniae]